VSVAHLSVALFNSQRVIRKIISQTAWRKERDRVEYHEHTDDDLK
jgi:hypothetical protein